MFRNFFLAKRFNVINSRQSELTTIILVGNEVTGALDIKWDERGGKIIVCQIILDEQLPRSAK
jgi:hypothetical protein